MMPLWRNWPVVKASSRSASVEDMARPGLFDSDQEWNEFLADLYASRRADLA